MSYMKLRNDISGSVSDLIFRWIRTDEGSQNSNQSSRVIAQECQHITELFSDGVFDVSDVVVPQFQAAWKAWGSAILNPSSAAILKCGDLEQEVVFIQWF
jgi:hypothetical protein